MKPSIAFLALREASALTEILVLDEGEVRFSHSAPLQVDEEAAKKIITAFENQGVQLPIDYEHATIIKGEHGEKAPAAGWITALQWKPGRGLVASVEWTEEARSYIKQREYKYLSPVVAYDEETRAPYKLHSMALTNKPATKNQRELLAASATLLEEALPMASKTAEASDKGVKKKGVLIAQEGGEGEGEGTGGNHIMKIAVALTKAGFEVDASNEDAVMQAVLAFIESKTGETGEPEGEPGEEVAASDKVLEVLQAKDGNEAILKLKADFVPRKDYKLLSDRFTALEARDKGREIDTVLARLIDENRILPDDEEHLKACRASAEKDLDAFVAFMAAQPPYMEPGRKVTPVAVGTGSREAILVAAMRDYDLQEPAFKAMCRRRSYVNDEFRGKDLAALTPDELTKHGIGAD